MEPTAHAARVFDCFLFDGDMQALALRLRELDELVDVFVVVESVQADGTIHFNALDRRLAGLATKIRHVVDESAASGSAGLREGADQGAPDALPNDLVVLSHASVAPAKVREAIEKARAQGVSSPAVAVQYVEISGKRSAVVGDTSLSHDKPQRPPVVICPYLYDHEPAEVIQKFGLDLPEHAHIRVFFWKDEKRIGPERAYEHCWSQFPDDDIIILHTDMGPMPGQELGRWFDELCRYRSAMPWAGMIACNLVHPRRSRHFAYEVQCAGGTFVGEQVAHLHGRLGDTTGPGMVQRQLLEHVRLVDWVTFGGVLIRRELIRACGPFDKRYGWAYYMDVDYCFEARLRGFVLAQVPVLLEHEESRTTRIERKERPELTFNMTRNRDQLHDKWQPFYGALCPPQLQGDRALLADRLAELNALPVRAGELDCEPAPPGLIMLAMHRSGSSCLAGMLQGSGFYAGEVFQWNEDNRKGNQEDLRIIEMNDLVLQSSGGSWSNPPDALTWTAEAQRRRDELLLEFYASPSPWMFKDPRTLLTLPFWLQAVEAPRRLGIFRNPLSVAESLATRNGLALRKGLQIWATYNRALLIEHARAPFPVVCFDEPRGQFIESVRRALEAVCGDLAAANAINPELLGSFYDEGLVHQNTTGHPAQVLEGLPGIDEALLSELTQVYDSLCDLSGFKPQAGNPAEVDPMLVGLLKLEAAQAQGGPVAAYAACDELLAAAPERADLWMRLVAIAKQSGDANKVETAISRGLAMLPADAFLWLEQAVLHWNAGRIPFALQSAERAALIAPDWREPRILLTSWLVTKHRWRDVKKFMGEMPLKPGRADRWGHLLVAVAASCMGDREGGQAAMGAATEAMEPAERQVAYSLLNWGLRVTEAQAFAPSGPHSKAISLAAWLAALQRGYGDSKDTLPALLGYLHRDQFALRSLALHSELTR